MASRLVSLRDSDDTDHASLRYNYFVKPPGGVEYPLLAAPAPLTSIILSTLPVGVSSVRAVAIDSRYGRCCDPRRLCPEPALITAALSDAWCGAGRSGDRTFTDPVDIDVTVAPEQVQATVLQQMLDDTIAAYARRSLARPALPIRSRLQLARHGHARHADSAASTGDLTSILTIVQNIVSVREPACAHGDVHRSRLKRSLSDAAPYCAQVLRDPEALENLTPEEQAALRKQLSDAVALTANLTEAFDADTGKALVTALNAVVLASSDMDAALFNQVLELVRTLAAYAGDAAAALLDIVAAMLRNRGTATNEEADTINESLQQLTLALLETAVCGEAARTVEGDGIQLNAGYQSSYTDKSYDLLGGTTASFGDMSQFEESNSDVVDDSICKKTQLLVQSSSPYVASNTSELEYEPVTEHQPARGNQGDLTVARARGRL